MKDNKYMYLNKLGRPCARQGDDMGKDARVLGIRNSWATTVNREEWRKFLREAKTVYEL
jgi:hypothetical protein